MLKSKLQSWYESVSSQVALDILSNPNENTRTFIPNIYSHTCSGVAHGRWPSYLNNLSVFLCDCPIETPEKVLSPIMWHSKMILDRRYGEKLTILRWEEYFQEVYFLPVMTIILLDYRRIHEQLSQIMMERSIYSDNMNLFRATRHTSKLGDRAKNSSESYFGNENLSLEAETEDYLLSRVLSSVSPTYKILFFSHWMLSIWSQKSK